MVINLVILKTKKDRIKKKPIVKWKNEKMKYEREYKLHSKKWYSK